MDRIKKTFSSKDEEDENIVSETSALVQISDATKLSWSTRIKCFAVCFTIGVVLSVLSTIVLFKNIKMFAVLYTFGNIASISSTMFLMGPVKQVKNMFKEKRLIATIVMLVSLILTLCAALWWDTKPLALVFCIIQYLAMTWYALSYIPFARNAVKGAFNSCMA